jgi:hypothetical protein
MVINKTCARRTRQLISQLLRRRWGDPSSVISSEGGSTQCFGPLGGREQLALEGFTVGDRPATQESSA